jgi:hypothetical protein
MRPSKSTFPWASRTESGKSSKGEEGSASAFSLNGSALPITFPASFHILPSASTYLELVNSLGSLTSTTYFLPSKLLWVAVDQLTNWDTLGVNDFAKFIDFQAVQDGEIQSWCCFPSIFFDIFCGTLGTLLTFLCFRFWTAEKVLVQLCLSDGGSGSSL